MRETRYHGTPRNQIPQSIITHGIKYSFSSNPIPAFGIQAYERVQYNCVQFYSRLVEFRVNKLAKFKISGSDARFKEDGEGSEVWGELVLLGHNIKD